MSGGGVVSIVGRVRDALSERGVVDTVVEAGRRVETWARPHHEEHFWWELKLDNRCAAHPLADGVTVRSLPEAEIGLTSNLPVVNFAAHRERYRAGGEFWVAMFERRVIFGVWVYPSRLPVDIAPGGWIDLPSGVCGLEDAAAAEEARGRNVALAALGVITEDFERRGYHTMIAKTAVDNRPVFVVLSRKGFKRVARMHSTFAGPVKVAELTEQTTELIEELGRTIARGATSRIRRAVRMGAPGRSGAVPALARLRRRRHLWWMLDLTDLVSADPAQPDLETTTVAPDAVGEARWRPFATPVGAEERFRCGGSLQVVMRSGKPVFGCWLFPSSVPVGSPTAWYMLLPPGAVGVELAAGAAEHGTAAVRTAAIRAIARRCTDDGHRVLLTRTAPDDAAAAELLESAGCRVVAVTNSAPAWPGGVSVRITRGCGDTAAGLVVAR